MKICSVDGCEKMVHCRGLCPMHYYRWRVNGDVNRLVKNFTKGRICYVEGCANPVDSKDLCRKHYFRMYRHGSVHELKMRPSGTGTITRYGYVAIGKDKKTQRLEHVLIAERALGKPLPKGADVHHVNRNRQDNRNENIVICQSRSYHFLLHMRTEALEACGNPDYRKCYICGEYDDPKNLVFYKKHVHYKQCNRKRFDF